MRLLFLLCLWTLYNVAFAQPPTTNRDVVFRSVNVVPMDRERVLPNQTVVVRNGRIVAMGPAAQVKVSHTAEVIDGRGKFLLPGWAEMHAHVPPIDDLGPMQDVLTLYLANGITTIRGMLGHPKHLELRSKLQSGEVLGPHLFTTGPSFNGQSVKTPGRGAEMVREQKRAGYDFLKLHPGLTNQTFPAIARTADSARIGFVGHVSFNVGVWRAITANYSSIDHLDGFVEALVPGMDTLAEPEAGLFAAWIADRADASRIPKLVNALRDAGIYVVPTQALAERWLSPEPAAPYLAAPEMKYMAKRDVAGWTKAKEDYLKNPNFSPAKARALIDIRRKLILACQRAGVPLLLGSDAPQIFNVPGFAIHHEMQYMVAAGLTPYETLRSGTVNVARYLKQPNAGTVKVGNVADLVLLGGNPLRDIGQTRAIEGVMLNGRWLPKAYFDEALQKLEK